MEETIIYIIYGIFAIFAGTSTYLGKNVKSLIEGKRIKINMDLVYEYFVMNFTNSIKNRLDDFNDEIKSIDQVPDYLIDDIVKKFIEEAPDILTGAKFTKKGLFKNKIDEDKVREFIKGQISNILF